MNSPGSSPLVLDTVGGVDAIWDGAKMSFVCGLMIDGDGSGGNPEGDPDFQADTTLHGPDGKAINARKVPGFVLPPQLLLAVAPKVLGCIGRATNAKTGLSTPLVVHDIGPRTKLGEGTINLADRLGVPSNPRTGGEERRVILVEIWPGVPAVIDGITYVLQRYALGA